MLIFNPRVIVLVHKDIYHLSHPQGITFTHCIADIMLIRSSDISISITLDSFDQVLHRMGNESNLNPKALYLSEISTTSNI